MRLIFFTLIFSLISPLACYSQDLRESAPPWILSDKIIEFAVPMFIITLVLNAMVTIIKFRGNQKLKERMLDNNVSLELVSKMFSDSDRLVRLEPLKWVLLTLSLAISFLTIQSIGQATGISELNSLAIVFLLISAAFFTYYIILNRKRR